MNKQTLSSMFYGQFIFHLCLIIDLFIDYTEEKEKLAIDMTQLCKRISLEIWKKYKDSHRITK
jgi:hypothetical protein